MALQVWWAALVAAVAVAACWPGSPGAPLHPCGTPPDVVDDEAARADLGWLRRHRLLWSVLAGVGAWAFLGGPLGVPAGVGAAVGVWVVVGRTEPASVVRRRALVQRELPHVVTLLAVALRSGAAPADAVLVVCRALPGPAVERLALVSSRLRLGASPVDVWDDLARDEGFAPLARTMSRALRSGAPVVAAVDRLAVDLAGARRADVEDRARAVGVKAAVPLGLCLLPAFLLLGIAPLVGGLLGTLAW